MAGNFFGGACAVRGFNPDGSGDHLLVSECADPATAAGAPQFSPDGRRLMYPGGDVGGLFVAGAKGGRVRKLPVKGFQPAWAPDGRRITFVKAPTNFFTEGNIWRARLDGRGRRRLARGVWPRWSPQGRFIVYLGRRGAYNRYEVRLMRARTGKLVRVLGRNASKWLLDISPDGRFVIYARDPAPSESTPCSLVIVPTGVRLGRARELDVPGGCAARSIAWSPDGTMIAYNVRRTEPYQEDPWDDVYVAPIAGGSATRIYSTQGTVDDEMYGTLTWQPLPRASRPPGQPRPASDWQSP